jgi:hypothetical protein
MMNVGIIFTQPRDKRHCLLELATSTVDNSANLVRGDGVRLTKEYSISNTGEFLKQTTQQVIVVIPAGHVDCLVALWFRNVFSTDARSDLSGSCAVEC